MIAPLFIDTGAFIARILRNDQFHPQARALWQILQDNARPLYSSEHVLDECATLIARRASYETAAEWLQRHLTSKSITWLRANDEDLLEATKIMKRYSDQRVSFTDCISFVLMKRERCRHAFSFDEHFRRAGFVLFAE